MLSFKKYIEEKNKSAKMGLDNPNDSDWQKRSKRLDARQKDSYTRAEAEKYVGHKNIKPHTIEKGDGEYYKTGEKVWLDHNTGEILGRKGWTK